MKFFNEGKTQNGYGPPGIILEEIFSIRNEADKFIFCEECDGYFSKEYTKDEAIDLLREAISWIENK